MKKYTHFTQRKIENDFRDLDLDKNIYKYEVFGEKTRLAGPGGIEPPLKVLETSVLPLYDGPMFYCD